MSRFSLPLLFKFFIAIYFLVGMHIVLDTPGGTGLYLSYNVIAWLITVILISLGLWKITINKKVFFSKMLLFAFMGFLFLLIPFFYNFEFTDHAIPRILALAGGLLLLLSFYQFNFTKREKEQFLWLVLAAVAIEALIGVAQFFLFEEGFWGGYKLGISRPHGVFLQPNVMASFMATGLTIALFLSSKNNHPQHTHSFNFLSLLQKTLLYIVLFTSSFLLLLLQSRTGYVGVLVAFTLIAPYLYSKNRKKLIINLMVIFMGVFTALACFEKDNLPKRDDSIYQTVGARDVIFEVSADMVITKPLTGYGYGHFERSFLEHFNQYAKTNPDVGKTIERLSHPHNEVLYWSVEGGIFAILAFSIFTFAYIRQWLKIPRPKAFALLALAFPVLLHSQLEFPFYSSVSHFIIFLILLWFTDTSQRTQHKAELLNIKCNKAFLIRFLAILFPMLFIPFLVTSLHTSHIMVEYESSKNSSVIKLTEIVNPIVWRNRLDSAIYSQMLVSGIANQDRNKLQKYVDWGLIRIRHKPRVSLYKNILLAMRVIGDKKNYDRLLKEAKRIYPQQDVWYKKSFSKSYFY